MGGIAGMGRASGLPWLMATRGEISPHEYRLLDSAIKQIVGPQASATPAIVAVALRQGGPPTTAGEMLEYMPHFVSLARQLHVKPPGVVGRPTSQQLQNSIIQRTNQWMQHNQGVQHMNFNPMIEMGNSIAPGAAPVFGTALSGQGSNALIQASRVPNTNMAKFGINSIGSMMQLIAMREEIPPQEYRLLDSAIKQIVGPQASATPAILAVALRQGGPPMTAGEMLEYMPHFVSLARQLNAKPPGVIGHPTTHQLQNYIIQRTNQWILRNQGRQANTNPVTGMTNSMVPVQSQISAPDPTAQGSNVAPASTALVQTSRVLKTNEANLDVNNMGSSMQPIANGGLEGRWRVF